MSVHDERNPENRDSWHEAQREKLRADGTVLKPRKPGAATMTLGTTEGTVNRGADELPQVFISKRLPSGTVPAHYAGAVTPWDLQKCMKSSGNAFVDARRTDAIEYAFRLKGDLLGDLIKAWHCLDEAITVLKAEKNK